MKEKKEERRGARSSMTWGGGGGIITPALCSEKASRKPGKGASIRGCKLV